MKNWKLYSAIVALCLLANIGLLYANRQEARHESETAERAEAKDGNSEDGKMPDTGWQNLTTTSVQSGTPTWSSASNALAEDAAYATQAFTAEATGPYIAALGLTSTIPSGAQIDGIEIQAKAKLGQAGRALHVDSFQMIINGAEAGTEQPGSSYLTASLLTYGVGGATNLLGLSSPSAADLNLPNSGFRIKFSNAGDDPPFDVTVQVDVMQIKIYYTETTVYGTGDLTMPGMDAEGTGRMAATGDLTLPGMSASGTGRKSATGAATLPGIGVKAHGKQI